MGEYNELDIVGAEVYQILNLIPKEEYDKVPSKLIEIFNKYKNVNIELDFDMNKNFVEQKINQKTKDIMFKIAFDYWLTDEERKKSIEKMKLNEKKIKEKYSIEKIFDNNNREKLSTKEKIEIKKLNQIEEPNKEQTALVVKRENIFAKILNKIKSFFNNLKK